MDRQLDIGWLITRVLELTYTAWDLEAFALDCGYAGPPFRWDEERRFLLRCELDAAYFHLYLGSPSEWGTDSPQLREMFPTPRDAVDYIMETFPIVKRKDINAPQIKNDSGEVTTAGRYITKDTILEIYDEMQKPSTPASPTKPASTHPPAHPPTPKATSSPWPNGTNPTGPPTFIPLVRRSNHEIELRHGISWPVRSGSIRR